jgi:hypothetical protein
MQWFRNKRKLASFMLAMMLFLYSSPGPLSAGSALASQQSEGTEVRQGVVTAFEERVKEYVKMRERLEEKLPKLSKEATPEEIEAHKNSFTEMVRAARSNAKPGDLFTSDIADHIRAAIRREFKGARLKELRERILEAETKGVPVRINYPYPESKELTNIPPTLLLILPELPKQMRYRFVSKHMLLVDRENHLIIDYMIGALP